MCEKPYGQFHGGEYEVCIAVGMEAPVVYTDGTALREAVQTAMQAARRTKVPSHARSVRPQVCAAWRGRG